MSNLNDEVLLKKIAKQAKEDFYVYASLAGLPKEHEKVAYAVDGIDTFLAYLLQELEEQDPPAPPVNVPDGWYEK